MKAAIVLVQSFASIMTSANTAKKTLCKDEEIKKALLEADEASKIMSNNNRLDEELTRYKTEYLGRMKKKLRTLLEME